MSTRKDQAKKRQQIDAADTLYGLVMHNKELPLTEAGFINPFKQAAKELRDALNANNQQKASNELDKLRPTFEALPSTFKDSPEGKKVLRALEQVEKVINHRETQHKKFTEIHNLLEKAENGNPNLAKVIAKEKEKVQRILDHLYNENPIRASAWIALGGYEKKSAKAWVESFVEKEKDKLTAPRDLLNYLKHTAEKRIDSRLERLHKQEEKQQKAAVSEVLKNTKNLGGEWGTTLRNKATALDNAIGKPDQNPQEKLKALREHFNEVSEKFKNSREGKKIERALDKTEKAMNPEQSRGLSRAMHEAKAGLASLKELVNPGVKAVKKPSDVVWKLETFAREKLGFDHPFTKAAGTLRTRALEKKPEEALKDLKALRDAFTDDIKNGPHGKKIERALNTLEKAMQPQEAKVETPTMGRK